MWAEKVDTRSPDHTYWLLVLPSSLLHDIENHFIFKARYWLTIQLAKCYRYIIYIIRYIKEQTPLKMKYWIYAGYGVYKT